MAPPFQLQGNLVNFLAHPIHCVDRCLVVHFNVGSTIPEIDENETCGGIMNPV
jgi:hypothetical protein